MHIQLTKTCLHCGEEKPLDAFFLKSQKTRKAQNPFSLRRGHCKSCHRREQHANFASVRWQAKAVSLQHKHGGPKRYGAIRKALGDPTTCYLCGESLAWADAALDHIVPVAQGGTAAPENLGWTHRWCNTVKGALSLDQLLPLLQKIMEHRRQVAGR